MDTYNKMDKICLVDVQTQEIIIARPNSWVKVSGETRLGLQTFDSFNVSLLLWDS